MTMKKIINGKIYNTKTAELIHEYDNGIYGNDFRSLDEALYKTKKGAYFIAGSGGPMTKYARICGDSQSSGEGIKVLSEEEAVTWLEKHDGDAALEKHFKERIEEA